MPYIDEVGGLKHNKQFDGRPFIDHNINTRELTHTTIYTMAGVNASWSAPAEKWGGEEGILSRLHPYELIVLSYKGYFFDIEFDRITFIIDCIYATKFTKTNCKTCILLWRRRCKIPKVLNLSVLVADDELVYHETRW